MRASPANVMTATWSSNRDAQAIYNRLWGSGFLPSNHQGVALRSQGDPVLFVSNPGGMGAERRRQSLDAVRDLNQMRYDVLRDPEIEAMGQRARAFAEQFFSETAYIEGYRRLLDTAVRANTPTEAK